MNNVLAAIAAFGAMIFVHELGHFLMARRAGVRVHVFALGFGPQVVGWQRGETRYAINLIPLGGFVRMEGEDNQGTSGPGSFTSKSVGARMAIIAAGPIMNLLMAAVILAVAAGTGGIPAGPSAIVGTVEDGWPAAAAGLQQGDLIVSIDGVIMPGGERIIETIHRSAGRPLELRVRRGTQELVVTVTPRLDPARGVGRIGFSPEPLWKRLGPQQALAWGVERTWQLVATVGGALVSLTRERKLLESLGGPVAAGSILAQAAGSGPQVFFHVAAFLSVIIGFFNLLPLPALDGGRLAFLLVEAVRRRPLDPRREGLVHTIGFALLLLLLVGLTIRDVARL